MERDIMTWMTDPAEIHKRYWDEWERCSRWGRKECQKRDRHYTKFDIPQEIIDCFQNEFGIDMAGYITWQSPINGDKWLDIIFEKVKKESWGNKYQHAGLLLGDGQLLWYYVRNELQ